jgi:hypothetical protein
VCRDGGCEPRGEAGKSNEIRPKPSLYVLTSPGADSSSSQRVSDHCSLHVVVLLVGSWFRFEARNSQERHPATSQGFGVAVPQREYENLKSQRFQQGEAFESEFEKIPVPFVGEVQVFRGWYSCVFVLFLYDQTG